MLILCKIKPPVHQMALCRNLSIYSCISVSVCYLSTGLLWRLSTDGVQSGQIQAVHWQLVQVVQQGRGQVGALS